MLYVHQSLGPNEEILSEARFHWMYTVSAVFWIIFGIVSGIAIAYAAIWWNVSSGIREYYPNLPDEFFNKAWGEVVAIKGGYLKILWSLHPAVRFSVLGSFILGLFLFANMMIIKATTEIAATNERIVYKKGLIARNIGELSIDRIEGVSVRQNFWGRILGYGRVSVRGMGVGEVLLPTIEKPIEFRKIIQEARAMHDGDKTEPVDPEDDF